MKNEAQKVRVIAKIRGFAERELESSDEVLDKKILVHKPKGEESEQVSISFGDHSASCKESYEVDYCYEHNEENDLIFSKEIKPMISRVFDGRDATVIAYGARGTGKTFLIQGSDEKHGLAMLAMIETLRLAEENGKSVYISLYDIIQDGLHEHVHDLLELGRSTNSIAETQGKIQQKGLSQVQVDSISEFQRLCSIGSSLCKPTEKTTTYSPRRSHRVLIIHVTSHAEKSCGLFAGKINFVDLAGYEGTKKKCTDPRTLAENTKINKSLYALQSVVYALNANECHIPYRESKLALMLRDSLGGANKTLMVTCLNPTFCQDSLYVMSLASRSSKATNQVVSNSSKKIQSSAKQMVSSQTYQGVSNPTKNIQSSAKQMLSSQTKQVVSNSTKNIQISAKQMVSSQTNQVVSNSRKNIQSLAKMDSSQTNQVVTNASKKIQTKQMVSSQTNLHVSNSTKKIQNSAKQVVSSQKNRVATSVSNSEKKQVIPTVQLSERKTKTISMTSAFKGRPAMKGRKLFDASVHSTKAGKTLDKNISSKDIVSNIESPSEPQTLNSLADISLTIESPSMSSMPEETIFSANIGLTTEEIFSSDVDLTTKLPSVPEEEKTSALLDDVQEHASSISNKDMILMKSANKEESIQNMTSSSMVDEGQYNEKENNNSLQTGNGSPLISARLEEVTNNLRMLFSSTPSIEGITKNDVSLNDQISTDTLEPQTPKRSAKKADYDGEVSTVGKSPWQTLSMRSSGVKNSLAKEYLTFINSANRQELLRLKGIGEKRATYILELRKESPEPFKNLEDLRDIGMSSKQIKDMMKNEIGDLFQ